MSISWSASWTGLWSLLSGCDSSAVVAEFLQRSFLDGRQLQHFRAALAQSHLTQVPLLLHRQHWPLCIRCFRQDSICARYLESPPYFTVLCCTVLYCAVLCCAVLYCAVIYYAVLYCTVLCCTLLCCTVLCCTLLCCTLLCCTLLCCTVLYCAVLYCTVLYCRATISISTSLRSCFVSGGMRRPRMASCSGCMCALVVGMVRWMNDHLWRKPKMNAAFCAVLYYAVLHCAVLYCTILYCTVLRCTVLCCTLLCLCCLRQ